MERIQRLPCMLMATVHARGYSGYRACSWIQWLPCMLVDTVATVHAHGYSGYRACSLHTSVCGTPSKMSSIGSVSVLVQRRVSLEHMEAISG